MNVASVYWNTIPWKKLAEWDIACFTKINFISCVHFGVYELNFNKFYEFTVFCFCD